MTPLRVGLFLLKKKNMQKFPFLSSISNIYIYTQTLPNIINPCYIEADQILIIYLFINKSFPPSSSFFPIQRRSKMVADLSKLLAIMVISLAVQTTYGQPPINQSEDDQLLTVLALDDEPQPDELADLEGNVSLSAENASPPEPLGDEFLSPEYPSPTPEIASDHRYELSPQYSSPSPYGDDDEFYSRAPTTPAVPSSSSQISNYALAVATTASTTPDMDYVNIAPTPVSNVLPFTYEAEVEVNSEIIDEEESQGEFKGTVVGFVVFTICFFGLGGIFVYNKKQNDKRKSQYVNLGKS